MVKAIIIVLASLPIVWISRRSLLSPASHGFTRFFALETILALLVLNAPYWFRNPLGIRQAASWLLLFGSIVLVVSGVAMLRRHGDPGPTDPDSPLYNWENTSTLVTGGVFRYVRHPMYASLLYVTWGAMLKSIRPWTVTLAIVATIALFLTTLAEEKENTTRFGDEYVQYMQRTRRFIPFLL